MTSANTAGGIVISALRLRSLKRKKDSDKQK